MKRIREQLTYANVIATLALEGSGRSRVARWPIVRSRVAERAPAI